MDHFYHILLLSYSNKKHLWLRPFFCICILDIPLAYKYLSTLEYLSSISRNLNVFFQVSAMHLRTSFSLLNTGLNRYHSKLSICDWLSHNGWWQDRNFMSYGQSIQAYLEIEDIVHWNCILLDKYSSLLCYSF